MIRFRDHRILFLAVLCCALLATPSLARAAPTVEESAGAARGAGDIQFATGNWRDALPNYQRAWDLAHVPADLLRVGRCHYNLGEMGLARETLFEFLQLDPANPKALEAFAILVLIDKAEPTPPIAAVSPPPSLPKAVTAAPAAPPPASRYPLHRKVSIGAAGVALVLAGIGSVYAVQAQATNQELGATPHSRTEVANLQDQLSHQAKRANGFFIAAGVALSVAALTWVVKF